MAKGNRGLVQDSLFCSQGQVLSDSFLDERQGRVSEIRETFRWKTDCEENRNLWQKNY